MLRQLRKQSASLFLYGLALGVILGGVLGLGMLVGALASTWYGPRSITFPETRLQATATHGSDTFALATGPVGDEVEGLFVLDYLTGELQCFVIYPRTGVLGGRFQVNVIKDLGIEQGKKPNYLLVTGAASFRRATGNARPANCIVYVGDANTGTFTAYSIMWNAAWESANKPQTGPMVSLGTFKARNLNIRE
jgi:hypothetical protein